MTLQHVQMQQNQEMMTKVLKASRRDAQRHAQDVQEIVIQQTVEHQQQQEALLPGSIFPQTSHQATAPQQVHFAAPLVEEEQEEDWAFLDNGQGDLGEDQDAPG